MRKQDIEITISPTGEVSFTVKGVKGASCIDETKFLEEALGGGVIDRERTSEYYEAGDGVGASQWASSGEESDD
jgi:hypothetical protein